LRLARGRDEQALYGVRANAGITPPEHVTGRLACAVVL
jgi:hypothetical protein